MYFRHLCEFRLGLAPCLLILEHVAFGSVVAVLGTLSRIEAYMPTTAFELKLRVISSLRFPALCRDPALCSHFHLASLASKIFLEGSLTGRSEVTAT